jgi:hypothetical protein
MRNTNKKQVQKLYTKGYIDAFSQRGQLYAQRPTSVVRALGVNHNKQQTHERVREIIGNAFGGQHGEFFSTSRR